MEEEIRAPDSGAFDWTEVRQFNLMFKTFYGHTATDSEDGIYLRPETAQGIFVNYKNVLDTARVQIPFGIAQTGKAFRNERSEEHTSELQSRGHLVCRLLLEKKNTTT